MVREKLYAQIQFFFSSLNSNLGDGRVLRALFLKALYQELGSQALGSQAYQDMAATPRQMSACHFDVPHITHKTECKHLFDIRNMTKAI
jgi:hypothetical protein